MFEKPRDAALDQLEPLLGEWLSESTHPMIDGVVTGRATFEWLAGRQFLIWRSQHERAIPTAIAIIGGGDSPGTWPMHYFDDRGVERVFTVTVKAGVIEMWRDHPGFSQRMHFVGDGSTLRLTTELNQGDTFKPDLATVYRRA